jgi:hypothetical protein
MPVPIAISIAMTMPMNVAVAVAVAMAMTVRLRVRVCGVCRPGCHAHKRVAEHARIIQSTQIRGHSNMLQCYIAQGAKVRFVHALSVVSHCT